MGTMKINKFIYLVLNFSKGNTEIIFKGTLKACKLFIKDNEFLYPQAYIKRELTIDNN